jgi:hypothetical protein
MALICLLGTKREQILFTLCSHLAETLTAAERSASGILRNRADIETPRWCTYRGNLPHRNPCGPREYRSLRLRHLASMGNGPVNWPCFVSGVS